MKTDHKSRGRPSVGGRKSSSSRADNGKEDSSQRESGPRGPANESRSNSVANRLDVVNLTLEALEYEEKEAIDRDTEEDVQVFNKRCDDIRELMEKMKILREKEESTVSRTQSEASSDLFSSSVAVNVTQDNEPRLHLQEELSLHKRKVCMLFLDLKKLNRFDKLRCKNARESVTEVKSKVDSYHLQLQNLLYEVMYLQKEINKCLEFRSKDEEIDLIPLQQFYEEAPSEISRPEETKEDVHKCTLARLEWELEQRKMLAETLQNNDLIKKESLEAIQSTRECLEKLHPMLKKVVEATQPLHAQLDLPLQATESQHSQSEYLPRSLYVLYLQTSAYKEAYKANIAVKINGNVEEAKALQFVATYDDEDSAESDNEEANRKKSKRHRKSFSEKRDAGLKRLTAAHPLSVSLTFTDDESKVTLTVEFFYMLLFQIITVKVNVSSSKDLRDSIILDDNVLKELLPGDSGEESPNVANLYHLKSFGIESFASLAKDIGFAYSWAQHLCGLHFLPLEVAKSSPSEDASYTDMLLKSVQTRFTSRLALVQQFSELERGMFSLPKDALSVSFPKLSCTFKEWTPLSLQQLKTHPDAEELAGLGLISDNWFMYKAKIERGSAELKAFVLISPDYPAKSPIFLLTLSWLSEKTSRSDNSLRDLERLVNVTCVKIIDQSERQRVLALQMHCLCVGFDVLLESDQSSLGIEGPREFPLGRIFAQMLSGRDHSKPFKYSADQGFFTCT